MSIYLITFGGGHTRFHDAVERVKHQAKRMNVFTELFSFTEHDLLKDKPFIREHFPFLQRNLLKGLGYWIWKPYLIHKVMSMDQIKMNDLICYVDCGCEFNIKGRDRLLEYMDYVKEHDSLAFQMIFPEQSYTKMDLLTYLDAHEEKETGQVMATICFFKKTDHNLSFTKEWFETCITEDYHYVDDTKSKEDNHIDFVSHRHDQSIFSILSKKYKHFLIPDETYYEDWKNGESVPILAKRNKSGYESVIQI